MDADLNRHHLPMSTALACSIHNSCSELIVVEADSTDRQSPHAACAVGGRKTQVFEDSMGSIDSPMVDLFGQAIQCHEFEHLVRASPCPEVRHWKSS